MGLHTLAVMVASILAAATSLLLLWLSLGRPPLASRQELTIGNRLDLLKISLAIVAGIGGVVALVVAYRRQIVAEEENRRSWTQAERESLKLFTERFTSSTGQLGNERAAVRIAGVYALTQLADDATDTGLRQACIDVLCAYIRMPYETDQKSPLWREGEKEVRRSIMDLVRAHLLGSGSDDDWSGHSFDFTGAVFDGFQLSGVKIGGDTSIDFSGARFLEGRNMLQRVTLEDGASLSFWNSEVAGGELEFFGSQFRGGTLWFRSTKFERGSVYFSSTEFGGPGGVELEEGRTVFSGTLADFGESRFSGADVHFDKTYFEKGGLWFDQCLFTGGSITFKDAQLTEPCQVSMNLTKFAGAAVDFDFARAAPGSLRIGDAVVSTRPPTVGESPVDLARLEREGLHNDPLSDN